MTKSGKHCGKRKNCMFAISSFVAMFSKSCLLQRRQKASIWGKGLMSVISQLIYSLSHEPLPKYRHFLMPLQPTNFEMVVTNWAISAFATMFQLYSILLFFHWRRFSNLFANIISESSAGDLLYVEKGL